MKRLPRALAPAEPLTFGIATESDELEQVHRLNYRTFVEEIPQHGRNPDRRLVDRFDDDNTYFIAKRGARVVGMLALRTCRPFSLDDKVPDLDTLLPRGWTFCEIRLLAVEPDSRNGIVFRGLIREVTRYCSGIGITASVISGTVRQLSLYRHLGFVPIGPRVGTAAAPYQPMYITLDRFAAHAESSMRRDGFSASSSVPRRYLPGPVDVHTEVQRAFAAPAESHRSESFMDDFATTQRLLCELTQASRAEILLGTGTLANDVVAAQLSALDEPGLVLANGEFGERLIDHALRAGLRFDCERFEWGDSLDAVTLEGLLALHRSARWIWMVHHETSTGVLNDITAAARLARDHGRKLCCDCISSIGVVPVDLRDVFLATGVSGKGLGAYAGLSFVFHRGARRATRVPRYLDLASYAGASGVPFTQSSPLLRALRVATERTLARHDLGDPTPSRWLRAELRDLGFRVVAAEECACPGIVTLALSPDDSALLLGDALARAGFEVSYRSAYLRQRNWLQVALMGECAHPKLALLLRAMRELRRQWSVDQSRSRRLAAVGPTAA